MPFWWKYLQPVEVPEHQQSLMMLWLLMPCHHIKTQPAFALQLIHQAVLLTHLLLLSA